MAAEISSTMRAVDVPGRRWDAAIDHRVSDWETRTAMVEVAPDGTRSRAVGSAPRVITNAAKSAIHTIGMIMDRFERLGFTRVTAARAGPPSAGIA